MKEAIQWESWTEIQEVLKEGMIGKKAVKEEVAEIVAKIVAKRKGVITGVIKIEEIGVEMAEIKITETVEIAEIVEIAEVIEIVGKIKEKTEKEKT